jgi:hypothetical protein
MTVNAKVGSRAVASLGMLMLKNPEPSLESGWSLTSITPVDSDPKSMV